MEGAVADHIHSFEEMEQEREGRLTTPGSHTSVTHSGAVATVVGPAVSSAAAVSVAGSAMYFTCMSVSAPYKSVVSLVGSVPTSVPTARPRHDYLKLDPALRPRGLTGATAVLTSTCVPVERTSEWFIRVEC